jgi:hypothetical protein
MLDFRKVLLALSVTGLLVGTASAQVPTLTSLAIGGAGFEGSVAIEGTTEQLNPAVVTCASSTGGGCTTAEVGSGVSFSLSANAPITNLTVPHKTYLDVAVTDNCLDTGGTATLSGTAAVIVSIPTVGCTLTTITVAGLRVNPSGLPNLQQVTLQLGPTTVVVSATTTTVNFAYVQKTLAATTLTASASQTACTITPTTVLYPVTTLQFQNGFPTSLKSPTDVEGASTIAATATSPTGTTLAITFSNLNPGVNYYVPASAGVGVTLTAVTSAEVVATPVASGAAAGLIALTVSATGTATAYYEVTAETGPTETTSPGGIVLSEIIPAVSGVTSYSASAVGASITLVSAATGYPQYSASQAAYPVANTSTTATGTLTACTTTLLFPYVINVAGFDTGLAITNASGVAAGSAGTCNVSFWGTGAPSTATITTPSINNATATNTLPATAPAGSVYAVYPFDVGTVAPGFDGYVVATCNFQGAHGYAFVSDGLGTGTGIAANYLAIVTSNAGLLIDTTTVPVVPTAQ